MRYRQYCFMCNHEWYTFKKPLIVSYDTLTGEPIYKMANVCKKCNKKLKEL